MNQLKNIASKLTQKMESEHFVLHYGLRNPRQGKGLGSSGVEDQSVLVTYLQALEQIYLNMTEKHMRRPPKTDAEGKTRVYIFDISELTPGDESPFVTQGRDGVPFICLPSRGNEPSTQVGMARATADAIHEATHLFNLLELQERGGYGTDWYWLDEGIAFFIEMKTLPGNHDHFRFLKHWVDMPETPLDDWAARYQSGMFISYLEKKMPGFANQAWMDVWQSEQSRRETPVETMIRLMALRGKTFVSCDPNERDFFASGYCLDSYFLLDHNGDVLEPELHSRFGGRAISESFVLHPNAPQSSDTYHLDHLACRYFRFYLKGDVTSLRVELRARQGQTVAPLKAELAIANLDLHRGEVIPLCAKPREDLNQASSVSAELPITNPENLDHLVLAVSNCGIRPNKKDDKEHDDDRYFDVVVEAR